LASLKPADEQNVVKFDWARPAQGQKVVNFSVVSAANCKIVGNFDHSQPAEGQNVPNFTVFGPADGQKVMKFDYGQASGQAKVL